MYAEEVEVWLWKGEGRWNEVEEGMGFEDFVDNFNLWAKTLMPLSAFS